MRGGGKGGKSVVGDEDRNEEWKMMGGRKGRRGFSLRGRDEMGVN